MKSPKPCTCTTVVVHVHVRGKVRPKPYYNPANFAAINSTRDGQNDEREMQFTLKRY